MVVDESKRKIVSSGWASELERPIYFLEHREGYVCGWCSRNGDHLIVMPHPASHQAPEVYEFPSEIDVVGQITGVAMRLDQAKRRHTRS